MTYDPNSVDFMERVQRLPEFREFVHENREKIFKYISLMYDLNTPMFAEVGDYWQRKKACATMCEFDKSDNGEFVTEYEDILLMKNEVTTPLIIIFITSFSSADYMQLIFSWEMMYKVLLESSLQESPDKSHVDTMRKLKIDINDLTKKVFHSGDYDENKEVKRLLYLSAELRRSNFRPEYIAKRLMSGDQLDEYNPYGNYSVGKMKFIGDEIPESG